MWGQVLLIIPFVHFLVWMVGNLFKYLWLLLLIVVGEERSLFLQFVTRSANSALAVHHAFTAAWRTRPAPYKTPDGEITCYIPTILQLCNSNVKWINLINLLFGSSQAPLRIYAGRFDLIARLYLPILFGGYIIREASLPVVLNLNAQLENGWWDSRFSSPSVKQKFKQLTGVPKCGLLSPVKVAEVIWSVFCRKYNLAHCIFWEFSDALFMI